MLETNTLIAAVVLGAVFFFSILLLSRRSSKAKSELPEPSRRLLSHGPTEDTLCTVSSPEQCV